MEKITQCIDCGKELSYKTKRPKWCKKCNPYKDTPIYRGNYVPTKSKTEFNIQTWLLEIYPGRPFIAGGYYSWMLSPKNYPLQLDFYIYGGEVNFAIEVDGKQHKEKQGFQSEEEFKYLQECDNIKSLSLKRMNIQLIRITTEECKTKQDFINILYKHGVLHEPSRVG